jgi:hypothetical protein
VLVLPNTLPAPKLQPRPQTDSAPCAGLDAALLVGVPRTVRPRFKRQQDLLCASSRSQACRRACWRNRSRAAVPRSAWGNEAEWLEAASER